MRVTASSRFTAQPSRLRVEISVWLFNCEADRDQEARPGRVGAGRYTPIQDIGPKRLIVVPLLLFDHPFCSDLTQI